MVKRIAWRWLALITAGLAAVSPVLADPLPPVRRLYIPHLATEVPWERSAVLWFGEVGPPGRPAPNYVDLRAAYTDEGLRLYVNVEDYAVWYAEGATASTDLSAYDAVAVYLDTMHDRADLPQPDDYRFLSALCIYGCGDRSAYRRQARGTGSGWDTGWTGGWSDATWASWWCDPGPNDNGCGIDFGWWTVITLPWSLFGLQAPPPAGTTWGLGVRLYDADDHPPGGIVPPEAWPETFDDGRPASWGEIVFGAPSAGPRRGHLQGVTTLRRGLPGGYVLDAWVGGGADCSGGHEGDPYHDNHGGDDALYVESQSLISDFPCFSRSYLRFGLDAIPEEAVILSATLTLHQWGNADWREAQPSLVWLYATEDTWREYGLTWNNAPPARENLDATWVGVIEGTAPWPGIPYRWDATRAVAEAHEARQPVNLALYTADTNMHSSKYFLASETGSWNAEGRPVLTVTWGLPPIWLRKAVVPGGGDTGTLLTYALTVFGDDQPLTVTDRLPEGVGAPISPTADLGTVQYDAAARRLVWRGTPPFDVQAHITYSVPILVTACTVLSSTASLTAADGTLRSASAIAIANPLRLYLPIILQRW